MPPVLSRLCVEHDHALVRVTVSHEELIHLGVHEEPGRSTEVTRVVATTRHPRLPDCKHVFTASGELVYQVGLVERDPDEVAMVDVDRMLPSPPFTIPRAVYSLPQHLALTSYSIPLPCGGPRCGEELPHLRPCLDHVPSGVELDDGRRRSTTPGFALDCAQLPAAYRPRALNDPDVALVIHRDPSYLAHDPLIREWCAGPTRVVLELRYALSGRLGGRRAGARVLLGCVGAR